MNVKIKHGTHVEFQNKADIWPPRPHLDVVFKASLVYGDLYTLRAAGLGEMGERYGMGPVNVRGLENLHVQD